MKERFKAVLLMILGTLSACASLYFWYYMLRLVDLYASGAIDAAHRTSGLRIGAAVFPFAAFAFGWISLACFTAKRTRTPTQSAPGSDR